MAAKRRGLCFRPVTGENQELNAADISRRRHLVKDQPKATTKPAERKSRPWFPKVKSGCLTCRIRRVKCDEGKPTCQRCRTFGVDCDGYEKSKPGTQLQRCPGEGTFDIPLISRSINRVHTGPRFTEESEGRYFRYYCEEIAAQITGAFRTSVWEHLIPQAGELEPYIGHAIVALGALSKSRCSRISSSHGRDLKLASSDSSSDPHHLYALAQYCKALKGMRDSIKRNAHDQRKALLACLLVFCFESLQGHQSSAATHASSGLILLNQWSREGGGPGATRPPPKILEQEVLIEEDLQSAVSGLDLHALLFLDNRPPNLHMGAKAHLNCAIALSLPSAFSNLKKCRNFWQLVLRRNCHFMAEARKTIIADDPSLNITVPLPSAIIATGHTAELKPGNNLWSKWDEPDDGTPVQIPLELIEERDRYVEDVYLWLAASEELFKRTAQRGTIEQADLLLISLMKIHAAMTKIMLAATFFPPEIEYDALLPEFISIAKLSKSIYPLLISSRSVFHFDIGVTPALCLVVMLCRDRATRGEVVEMLISQTGYREGLWDSEAVGQIGKVAMIVEEEYADENGFVPGSRRVSLSRCRIMLADRKVISGFLRRAENGPDEWKVREVEYTW